MNMIFIFILSGPRYGERVNDNVLPGRQRSISLCGPDAEADGEVRCLCGSLLARLVPDGVELKCRRCKRTAIVPLAWLEEREGEAGT
jgi:hypothetical protein